MKKAVKIFIKVIISLTILVTIPNYFSVIYKFQKSQKFSGNVFYNPYSNIRGNWIKANFHAHGKAYGGVSNGENSVEEMLAKYRSQGYDLACISNYGFIQDSVKGHRYVPAYEHGFNWMWIHQLVINDSNAIPFDYPLLQLRSNKQFMINRLKNDGNLIVLNHPSHKRAYTKKDLKYLNNYDFIEGISEFAGSISEWDQALSSGHAVWVLGNDDSHDTSDYHIGIAWNMIHVEINNEENILKSLKAGRTYATKGWLGQEMNRLQSLEIEDGIYRLKMRNVADSIALFSDNGLLVASVTNSDSISYKIKEENTYVRAQIFETESWNKYTMMYLNPVIRTVDGNFIQHNNKNQVNYFLSIPYWILLLIFHVVFVQILWKW